MRIKIVLLLAVAASAIGDDQGPRKLYRYQGDEHVASISTFSDPFDGIEYRLPNTTRPISYMIKLSTDIHEANFDFEGHVDITIEAFQETDVITLHSRQLTISSASILDDGLNPLEEDVPITFREDQEFLDIHLETPLVVGKIYVVTIDYIGKLRSDEAGFYASSYQNKAGETVWLATTQFESTDARHAFPCYDEPGIRAEFTIQIRHHQSYNAISNMPVQSMIEVTGTDYVDTSFITTKSVQSYLIAFMVSDFTYVEDSGDDEDTKIHRVYANPEYIELGYGDLAISASRKLINAFEEYLGVDYILDKMDQAAIPDFAAGAMENWGLVTYAEPYLLFNPAASTTRDRENVITTIAHEYAHQWFGDLVSPAWWNFLWLNEGFATLYENHITDLVFPGERWLDTFLIDTVQPVMETDANPNIRPMSYYVEDPERIEFLFDSVAYSKAGSVLKMFQNAFGDTTWKAGLNIYLTAKYLDSATPDDLHSSIQAAVSETSNPKTNIDAAMKSWENQAGFPYINVSKSGNVVSFQQNRFMYANRNSTNIYHVPINYVVSSNLDFTDTRADVWLDSRTVTLDGGSPTKPVNVDDWIVVNIQQSGFYRVNYDSNLWNSIVQYLNTNQFNQIHLFNRAQLIDDSHHLARAALIGYDTLINVMNYLEREDDYIPWASANRANTLINRWLTGSSIYPKYQEFMKKNSDKLFARLGVVNVENEQRVDRYARSVAINIACQAQNPSCLTLTEQRVAGVVLASETIEVDLVNTIYCNGLRTANSTVFLAFQFKMLQSTSQSERNLIITAMGCTQNVDLLYKYLNLAIIPGIDLTTAEKSRILQSPLNLGEASLMTMMSFVKNNMLELTSAQVIAMATNIASRVSSQELYNEFSSLVDHLRSNGLLTDTLVTRLRSSALTIPEWQKVNLDVIASVLDPSSLNTTPSTTRTIPSNTSPASTDNTTDDAGNIFLSTFILVSSVLIILL